MERLDETLDEGALDMDLGTKRSQKSGTKKNGEPKPAEKFGILGMRENGHQKKTVLLPIKNGLKQMDRGDCFALSKLPVTCLSGLQDLTFRN